MEQGRGGIENAAGQGGGWIRLRKRVVQWYLPNPKPLPRPDPPSPVNTDLRQQYGTGPC